MTVPFLCLSTTRPSLKVVRRVPLLRISSEIMLPLALPSLSGAGSASSSAAARGRTCGVIGTSAAAASAAFSAASAVTFAISALCSSVANAENSTTGATPGSSGSGYVPSLMAARTASASSGSGLPPSFVTNALPSRARCSLVFSSALVHTVMPVRGSNCTRPPSAVVSSREPSEPRCMVDMPFLPDCSSLNLSTTVPSKRCVVENPAFVVTIRTPSGSTCVRVPSADVVMHLPWLSVCTLEPSLFEVITEPLGLMVVFEPLASSVITITPLAFFCLRTPPVNSSITAPSGKVVRVRPSTNFLTITPSSCFVVCVTSSSSLKIQSKNSSNDILPSPSMSADFSISSTCLAPKNSPSTSWRTFSSSSFSICPLLSASYLLKVSKTFSLMLSMAPYTILGLS
mmetsp:Transcript_122271/g.228389  ORF Transcript_122271/g.228389 Transcript_122271/m.228389 type:complete len:400 (-) Transcript_122271:11-1210(-)